MVGTRYVTLGAERVKARGATPKGIDPSSSTGLGLDDAKVVRAVVTVEAGPLRWNTVPGATVRADGGDGSILEQTGAKFIIWGITDMDNFRFVPADTSNFKNDVIIMVRYEGTQ